MRGGQRDDDPLAEPLWRIPPGESEPTGDTWLPLGCGWLLLAVLACFLVGALGLGAVALIEALR